LELRQPLHHRDHCPIAPGVLRKPSKLLKVNNTFTKVILKVKHKYRTPIAQNASIFKVSKDLTRWLVAIYYVYDWQTRLSLEIPPSPKRNGKKKEKKRKGTGPSSASWHIKAIAQLPWQNLRHQPHQEPINFRLN
jgi:hypothetical protein